MPRAREKLVLANGPTPKITPQSDEKPLVYLSHTVVSTTQLETEFLRCSGVRYRCYSFVYIVPEAIYWSARALESYELNVKKGNHIMMDSGAFSFHMFTVKKKSIKDIDDLRQKTIAQYIKFCKERSKEWDFYVTFDYTQDVKIIRKVTKQLEDEGLKPVPVYHGDQSMDWLKRYLDAGYKRIGISNLPSRKPNYKATRKYMDEVFRTAEPYDVKLHGFAVTSLSLMYIYPWWSVDSSSWSRTASYGAIYSMDPERGSLANVHISTAGGLQKTTTTATSLSPEALESVRNQVERAGWDFDLLRKSLQYRFIYNGWVFANLHKYRKSVEETHFQQRSLF